MLSDPASDPFDPMYDTAAPMPGLTADQVLAQQLAEAYWAVATSDNHAIAWYRGPVYRHMTLALVAAVREAYGLPDLMARRVRDLLSEYGPGDSLRGTTGTGIASYAQFVTSPESRGYRYD
jgi:hypothetical protein